MQQQIKELPAKSYMVATASMEGAGLQLNVYFDGTANKKVTRAIENDHIFPNIKGAYRHYTALRVRNKHGAYVLEFAVSSKQLATLSENQFHKVILGARNCYELGYQDGDPERLVNTNYDPVLVSTLFPQITSYRQTFYQAKNPEQTSPPHGCQLI